MIFYVDVKGVYKSDMINDAENLLQSLIYD